MNADYVTALEHGDAAAAAAPYAEDAVFVAARNRIIRGRRAITQLLRRELAGSTFTGGWCKTDALRSTDYEAWETGQCRLVMKTEAGTRTVGGRFLTYWKRQANGAWMIEANIAE